MQISDEETLYRYGTFHIVLKYCALIILSSIEDPKQINVKRVIGLPGDTVSSYY